MKKFILLVIILLTGITFSQVNELIIESGTEFNIPLGTQIASDVINVNQYATFISQDPSGVADGTTINGDGVWTLPVEFNAFRANVNDNKVLLSWITITEINNYGFEIQRSKSFGEETDWEKIGFVNGSGNSSSSKHYTFADQNLIGSSKFMYRLKQIDNDGTFKFSELIEVDVIPDKFELFQNYPNPFNPSTKIRYQLPQAGLVSIKIYDLLGAEVKELVNELKEAGTYEVEFASENLPSAAYIYRLTTEGFSETKKMILLK